MGPDDEHLERAVNALERIALLLAAFHADGLGDIEQGEKAQRLGLMGFSNVQIARALGMTANAVNVALHRARHRDGKAGRAKKRRAA